MKSKIFILALLILATLAQAQTIVNPENFPAVTPTLTDNVYSNTGGSSKKISLQAITDLLRPEIADGNLLKGNLTGTTRIESKVYLGGDTVTVALTDSITAGYFPAAPFYGFFQHRDTLTSFFGLGQVGGQLTSSLGLLGNNGFANTIAFTIGWVGFTRPIQIRSTLANYGGTINADLLGTIDRDYNLPDRSGTFALQGGGGLYIYRDTMTVVNATTSPQAVQSMKFGTVNGDFSVTDSSITYTGTDSFQVAEVLFNASFESSATATVYLEVYKNDVLFKKCAISRTIGSGGTNSIGSAASTARDLLNPGDYYELKCSVASGTPTITFQNLNFQVLQY